MSGTAADLTLVATLSPRLTQPRALAKIMRGEFQPERLRAEGYCWFRITAPADDPDHVYLQAWRQKPEVEGALDRESAT